MPIKTIEHVQPRPVSARLDRPAEWLFVAVQEMRRLRGIPESSIPLSTSKTTVKARIDHGRWIADCPTCKGAEYVTDADPRFYCFSCENAKSNQWLTVVFPRQKEAIERALDKRQTANQNWKLNESVKDLEAENQRFGV